MKRTLSVFVLCNAGPYFVRTTRGDQRDGCQFQSADREFHPHDRAGRGEFGKDFGHQCWGNGYQCESVHGAVSQAPVFGMLLVTGTAARHSV
jgi:hypothetical protein